MTPTSTMTLSKFLEKDPTLYDNAISYIWNSDIGQWQTAPIREETKELLFEEFCDRYVNNDEKFKRLYVKKLNSLALRYAELRRNDLTAFDPLVADYIERKEVSQANAAHTIESEDNSSKIGQSSGTSQSAKTGAEGIDKVNVSDPQVIQYKKEKRTPDLTETTQTTGEESETKNEHADDKAVDKAAPMSISYPGAAAGKIPNLDWQSISAQKQTEHEGEGSSQNNKNESQTRVSGGTEEHASSEWSTGVDTVTDNTDRDWNESDNVEDSRNSSETLNGTKSEQGSNTEDKQVKVIQSGRGGLTPQEALARANEYIKGASAAAWLKKELQVCFRNVTYTPDEAWMY